MNQNDRELIIRTQENEEGAFEALYHRYYSNAYRIAYQITKSDADAQDAVQEGFIQIQKSIHSLRDPEAFYSWMARIILSKCNRIFVKNHYEPMDPGRIVIENLNKEERTYMIPHKNQAFQNDQEILLKMMDELKPAMREVLVLMYFEQMKLQDIAKELQIPLGTVKTRVVRARDDLKKKIVEFEKLEGRSLSFDVNTLFPLVSLGTVSVLLNGMKTHLEQFFTGQMVNVAGIVSVSTLAVSGTVFAYEEYQTAQEPMQATIAHEQQPMNMASQKQEELIIESNFQMVAYHEGEVMNPMQAYYTCINWAENLDQMKTKTKEQIEEILPVVEALKKAEGPYWQRLIESQWSQTLDEIQQGRNKGE